MRTNLRTALVGLAAATALIAIPGAAMAQGTESTGQPGCSSATTMDDMPPGMHRMMNSPGHEKFMASAGHDHVMTSPGHQNMMG